MKIRRWCASERGRSSVNGRGLTDEIFIMKVSSAVLGRSS